MSYDDDFGSGDGCICSKIFISRTNMSLVVPYTGVIRQQFGLPINPPSISLAGQEDGGEKNSPI